MKEGLSISVPDLGDPYRDVIVNYLSREFPANLDNKGCVMESVTAAMLASSKVRFGPTPSPESLVAIRKVISTSINDDQPIPVLCPWGSKKPSNTGIDIAELGGLKTLACLQKRVTAHYTPGIQINLRIEDIGGYYLFADEGDDARKSSEHYVADFAKLIRILGLDFINIKFESEMMDEVSYTNVAEQIRPVLTQYMTETDAYGMASISELESWKQLELLGWKGVIPMEQRDYYRERYAKLYPGIGIREQTNKLATYLAGSLARYKMKATGIEEQWGANFIQLNFAPPAPGTPAAIGDRRIYYRTLPEQMARTHLPAWRARGYLKIDSNNNVIPKIASWGEELNLEPSILMFERKGESVNVQADKLIA